MSMRGAFWVQCDGIVDGEQCEGQYPSDLGSSTSVDAAERARRFGFKHVMGPAGSRNYIWLCKHCLARRKQATKKR